MLRKHVLAEQLNEFSELNKRDKVKQVPGGND